MKKTILTILCAVLISCLAAQVPQGISHQAVVRNAENQLVINSPIGIRVSILKGAPDGTEVFSETHTPQSNANGLITFVIGQGDDQSSDFSAIDWADGPCFVKTEADPEGGTNYSIEGTSQLWSVPYALSSGSTGAGFTSGDSLVLKDEQGMTRFVLNPNTGTFKMMNNDTTWYSIEVKSPAKMTGFDNLGRYYERDFVTGSGIVYSDESKEKILEEKTYYSGVVHGVVSEEKHYYDNGNLKYYEKYEKIYTGVGHIHKREYIDYNEDGTIKKRLIRKVDSLGQVLDEEAYHGNNKQSETTHTSSTVPGMGLTSSTSIGRLFNANEDMVQETTQTTQIKATELENYLYKTNELKRFVGGVLLGKTKETDKLDILPDGSTTKISNKITEAEGLYTVLQKKEENGIQTEEKLFQKNPDLPGSGGTLRLEKSFTHDDNLSGLITKFNNPFGNLVFTETKTADRSNNSITTTVEAPSQGSTSIKQNNNEIELSAPQVVSNGDHVVTGVQTALGDSYISGNQTVYGDFYAGTATVGDLIADGEQTITGSSTIHGDQLVGGNASTLGNSTVGGNQEVSGNQIVYGDFYAGTATVGDLIADGEQTITGSSTIHGDQQVGGNVTIVGNLNVTGTKNFRFEHPADQNKYLVHAAIESNEVLNQYSGNVTTDADGLANVTLPDYFHLISIDFRYQLTVIGATFARAIIFSEIDENKQFVIKTDEPNTKVSWQVTAKRNDQYMIDNPFSDVVDK